MNLARFISLVLLSVGSVGIVGSAVAQPPLVVADPKVEILVEGVRLTLLAEHPSVVTPTGIDVDENGQIWAVSSHTHFRPEGYDGPEKDEILLFDGDGSNRRVFYEATVATMDLELGRGEEKGWVYLAERGRLLRVRDSDGDGVGDQEETLFRLQTEATYPHNGLSGLCWHPDGDLIFSLGENFSKNWILKGKDGAEVEGTGEGGIFRCTPDGRQLRRIASGFWNPFAVCVHPCGEMFTVDNDPGSRPPCRLLHLIEGGNYGYQRRYGNAPVHPFVAWDGELPGTLPMLAPTGEAPCGILPFGGGLLVPSWTDNRIDAFALERKGAGFTASRQTLIRGSDSFRPTCMAFGPDGAIYLTDWVDTSYELHGMGRIWKLEIDRRAPWVAPPIGPPNEQNEIVESMKTSEEFPWDLFELSRSDDPVLANSALARLARESSGWKWDDISTWPAWKRAAAVRALAQGAGTAQVAQLALADPSPLVVFEALRWISDKELKECSENVTELMKSGGFHDTRLFEAVLAASNTLQGKPNLGISDSKTLLAMAEDANARPPIRAHALRLLDPDLPKLTTSRLVKLSGMTKVPSEVDFEIVRTLNRRSNLDEQGIEFLQKTAQSDFYPERVRAEAVLGLVRDPGSQDLLKKLAAGTEGAVSKEANRAVRDFTMIEDAPALGATEAWLEKIDALPGKPDLEAGRRLFFHPTLARCASCHRHGGRGRIVGPELTTVGDRDDRGWLLESILQPQRSVPPQYHPRIITLKDGSVFTGFLLRSGGRSGKEFYRAIDGSEQAILKADVVKREESSVSLMPDGLLAGVRLEEIRDLLAFLEASRFQPESDE